MDETAPPRRIGRRGFLRGAAGAAGIGASAGAVRAQQDEEEVVELADYAFEPGTDQPLRIEPGTTVRFVWITSRHNIAILDAPAESDWEGVPDIHDAGFEHEHTFEIEGTYEFECVPHANLGMQGTIIVGEQDGNGGPAPVGPQLPDEAMTIGIGTALAMVATLGFAYVFLKYGGEPPTD